MPSSLPTNVNAKKEASTTAIPIHCIRLGRSPKKQHAIKIVQNGLVARMGAATVIGRFFNAKNANDQEAPTKSDLANK